MYIDKLNDIVNEYNNKYHRNIKMKLVNITSSAYIDFIAKKNKNKDTKFKVGDDVRISKYKSIFAKGYTSNLSEEVFVIKKVKNTVVGICNR